MTFIIIIIIRQPLCPVVGRRPQHAVSKLPCLVLSSAISCRSSICLGRLSTACRLFLSYGLQMVTREVHRSSLRRLICPAQDHFIFLTVLIISKTFVLSLTQTLVFLYLYVMLSILLSILVCAATILFCVCLVSVQVSAPYVIAGCTHELYTCLFRQMARLLLKMSRYLAYACHDSSVYLFVLVLFLDALVLSQVHVALDIFYQHIIHVYWGVVYNHHLWLCDLRPIRLLSSDCSCSICCSSCGVSVHRNMPSAKRRLERNSPSLFTPLFSQFNLLNMLSNVAVNSLGEMVSPCLTPLLILIFPLYLCICTVTELSIYVLHDLYVHIFYSLFLQCCQYCLGLY